MNHPTKLPPILGLDFSFLDDLPEEDWFPALLAFGLEEHATWYDRALIIDASDNPELLKDAQRFALEARAAGTLSLIVPTDLQAFKAWFLETLLPLHIRADRRRISDFRVALGNLRKYALELDRAGFDPRGDGAFTKLLKLTKAIASHEHSPEVFVAIVQLDTRGFLAYANGGPLPNLDKFPLKEFLNALNSYHQ